jgi:hypothetical protein
MVIPLHVWAKTPEQLTRQIAKIQAALGGKIGIISIYETKGGHICWYLPPFNVGMN